MVLSILKSEGRTMTPMMLSQVENHVNQAKGRSIDIGYIKTIIFPETNFYDVPQPLSSISFSRFSHKDEAMINTGPTGSGMLVWYPRCVNGPCLFVTYVPGSPMFFPPELGALQEIPLSGLGATTAYDITGSISG
jgi:hypothetical protein